MIGFRDFPSPYLYVDRIFGLLMQYSVRHLIGGITGEMRELLVVRVLCELKNGVLIESGFIKSPSTDTLIKANDIIRNT